MNRSRKRAKGDSPPAPSAEAVLVVDPGQPPRAETGADLDRAVGADGTGTRWDGAALLAAVAAGAARLDAHRQAVDVLNVFPVPDGDTGSNMSLTLRQAVEAGKEAVQTGRKTAGEVAAAVARGALLGARGNSGVILSQVLRGFAAALAGRAEIDGSDLARALDQAREMAYKAVLRPVEGTLLTVARGAAERAAKHSSPSPAACLAAALAGAEAALAETPSLLPILRQAGVVDAGGQGLVHVLAGMARAARGEPAVEADGNGAGDPTAEIGDHRGGAMAFLDIVDELHGEDAFGYCTNFLVHLTPGRAIDVERCRAELAAMGESAVVVGDELALKVHLHTLNPGAALEYAVALGALDQIKIENMELQTAALHAQREAAQTAHRSANGAVAAVDEADPATDTEAPAAFIVAVAAGEGLAEALRGMGAGAIVPGGQTMNPSVQELLAAVEAAPSPEVILLPNNPNVVLTASQVPALSGKRVAVIPSRSVPQGLAALTRFTPGEPLAVDAEQMTAALATVRTVEVTTATRAATIDGVAAAVGQAIGLVDDRLVAAGDDPLTVARNALARADVAAAELVTIFPGEGTSAAETEALRTSLQTDHPDLTVEIHAGGQPHYRYVISVE